MRAPGCDSTCCALSWSGSAAPRPYGECEDGTVVKLAKKASCDDNDGFKELLPKDYVPPTTTTTAAPATTAAPQTTAAPDETGLYPDRPDRQGEDQERAIGGPEIKISGYRTLVTTAAFQQNLSDFETEGPIAPEF